MNIGVANIGGVFDALPNLLSSLPRVKAEHFQPFGNYDRTIGLQWNAAKQIQFDPELERLEGKRYPVTIAYQEKLPLRLDRIVSRSDPSLLRRYESLIAHVGRLLVGNYSEVRPLIHSSIPVEEGVESSGIQLILHDGYKAKVDLLTAVARGQPFIAIDSDASSEVIQMLKCPYPWMLPFSNISDAISKLELIRMSQTLQESLDKARSRCLSERIHSRNLHLWAEALYG